VYFRQHQISCAFYHSDLDANARSRIHNKWLEGACNVLIATLAFGMGIDKPDVRFVIHHSVAKSMENYFQVQHVHFIQSHLTSFSF
jgi:superfamily II DNA helicase RecQ